MLRYLLLRGCVIGDSEKNSASCLCLYFCFLFLFLLGTLQEMLQNCSTLYVQISKLTNSNTCTTNALKIVWTESMTIFLKSSLILVPALKWVYHCDRTISTVTIVYLPKMHVMFWSILKPTTPKFWGKTKKIHCLMKWNGYRVI